MMLNAEVDLQALQKGDEAAWNQAFRVLWPCACYAALTSRVARSHDEAEDIAAIALRKLVEGIRTVQNLSHLKALLVTIAHCEAVSYVRHETAAKRPSISLRLEALPEHEAEMIINRQQLEECSDRDELADRVELLHQALECLDEAGRRLVTARVIEGKTYRELSAELNVSEVALRVKFSRALKELSRRLKGPRK